MHARAWLRAGLRPCLAVWRVRSARGAPVDTPATADAFFLLSETRALRLPTPPQQRNEGNFVISLSQLTRCAALARTQLRRRAR